MNNETFSMCTIDNLLTIKQETYYYCAAACLKMCIQSRKSQDEIFAVLKKRTKDKDNWYAEPDAVYSYLQEYMDCDRLSELDMSSLEATEKILSCIATTKTSAPMLVSSGKHWVLYSGYQMDENGNAKGIYVRDPWPTASILTFYPFCNYFFDEVFCEINVEGKFEGKHEAYVSKKTIDCIKIEKISKPQYGGTMTSREALYFKDDIINGDLKNYGFSKIGKLKAGGANFEDCIIIDEENNMPKYLLSYVEINNELSIVAIDIAFHIVVAITTATKMQYDLYSNSRIKKFVKEKYNKVIDNDDIKFLYSKKKSMSCFDPYICISNIGSFTLNLERLGEAS